MKAEKAPHCLLIVILATKNHSNINFIYYIQYACRNNLRVGKGRRIAIAELSILKDCRHFGLLLLEYAITNFQFTEQPTKLAKSLYS